MKFSKSTSHFNGNNKFATSVTKYKEPITKHTKATMLPQSLRYQTIVDDGMVHPFVLERRKELFKPIVENSEIVELPLSSLEKNEPLEQLPPITLTKGIIIDLQCTAPHNTPTESIISRVSPVVIEEKMSVVNIEPDETDLCLPKIYEPKNEIVTMQENPLRRYGARKISIKDTVSMVVSHNRCRKYQESNGWNS